MRRAPGWITLAGIALELSALAFISRVMELGGHGASTGSAVHRQAQDDKLGPRGDVAGARDVGRVASSLGSSPLEFIRESGDAQARYYRARDEQGVEMLAGFYSDGRVRLADADRRYAGMVENGHADMLDLANNAWSELFLSVTPTGRTQLELRGGPYDAHVLTCEPFDKLRMTR